MKKTTKKAETLWNRIQKKLDSKEWEHLRVNQHVVSCYDEIVCFGWQCYRLGKMDGKKAHKKEIDKAMKRAEHFITKLQASQAL